MEATRLSFFAASLGVEMPSVDPLVTGISTDTRTLTPGNIFVALKGPHFDGHDYIEAAQKAKAVALVVDRPVQSTLPFFQVPDTLEALGQMAARYWQQFHCPTIAITGSCGKTTIKQMVASVFAQRHKVLVTEKNYNNEIGVPLTMFGLTAHHQVAILEMGARQSTEDIKYLTSLAPPDVGVISCAQLAHTAYFRDLATVVTTKGQMVASLSSQGVAILNRDDPHFTVWQGMTSARILTFGRHPEALIQALAIDEQEDGLHFQVITPLGDFTCHLPVFGQHNVMNALAAIAVGCAMELPIQDMVAGLASFHPAPGRLQVMTSAQGARIINDTYNANPASTRAALAVLSRFPGKKIFVFGDMLELTQEQSAHLHHEIGDIAKQQGVDTLMTFGTWAAEAGKGFQHPTQHYQVQERARLIQCLKEQVTPETTVLIKGSRNMRMEEIVSALEE